MTQSFSNDVTWCALNKDAVIDRRSNATPEGAVVVVVAAAPPPTTTRSCTPWCSAWRWPEKGQRS